MQRTFTEVDIFDPQTHKGIEDYMQYLWSGLKSTIERKKLDLNPTQVDLVLELKDSDVASSGIACGYYFVNHNSRCLFWLHESDVKDVLLDCKGIKSLSHIRGWIVVVSTFGSNDSYWFSLPGLAIQAQYWCVLGKVRATLLTTPCDP